MKMTEEWYHSVRLIADRCKGCVNCTKSCPTEAIRIRDGKAQITDSRCIDCGECIRQCPTHAKTAVTDCMSQLSEYRYNIALPSPVLYAQFGMEYSLEKILCGLKELGFDEVIEVAEGIETVSLAIQDYLKRQDIKRPVISSSCPAAVRLIQVRFPELLDHILPLDAPIEVVARKIRSEKSQSLGIKADELGLWFITPCPAKMSSVKQPLAVSASNLTGAIGISKIYGDLLKVMSSLPEESSVQIAKWIGVGYENFGSESNKVPRENILIVQSIHDVIEVLEQVAMGKLNHIDYIECMACAGGCLGGPLTVENRFVAQSRMIERLKKQCEIDLKEGFQARETYDQELLGISERVAIEPRPVMRLDEDIFKAMHKVEIMGKAMKRLPGLDCGSCGSPTCKALAEDIAQGKASEMDCVFRLRERVKDLAQEMIDLADKLPKSMEKRYQEGRRQHDR